jgi:hypothetical protein
VKTEKTAPNSATTETIVAAMRKGDGAVAVDNTEEIRSKRAVAKRTKSSRRGMVFFISVTNIF